MKKSDSSINLLITEIRRLSEQISLLLKSADYIFQQSKWNILNSDVTSEISKSIDNPQKWFSEYFCRFYKNIKYPKVQIYIAVILDNRSSNSAYDFDEPIITGGYFWNIDNPDKVELWRCRWHVYTDNKNYKGNISSVYPKEKNWKESEKNFDYLKTMARPLFEINNSGDLQHLIIEPLINELNNDMNISS